MTVRGDCDACGDRFPCLRRNCQWEEDPNPPLCQTRRYNASEVPRSCDLAKDHDGPHRDQYGPWGGTWKFVAG